MYSYEEFKFNFRFDVFNLMTPIKCGNVSCSYNIRNITSLY